MPDKHLPHFWILQLSLHVSHSGFGCRVVVLIYTGISDVDLQDGVCFVQVQVLDRGAAVPTSCRGRLHPEQEVRCTCTRKIVLKVVL
jgi:hypothetical protein